MNLKEGIFLFAKGVAIGIADSVPGVSGGTIAIISGIYERLLEALRRCNPLALKVLWQQGLKTFWQQIDGSFLLILLLGILSSLIMMANTVLFLLDNYFMLVMAFFLGLVFSSCFILYPEMGKFSWLKVFLFVFGFVLTVLTVLVNPAAGSTSLLYLFICGAIAISAMILPGISGAFILILLGAYEYVLDALRNFNMDVVLVFAAGCALGLLSFAHVLTLMFRYHRGETYSFGVGMLAASVVVLWPWRLSAEPGAGLGMMPWNYTALTGEAAQLPLVLACVGLGFAIIVIFEKVVARLAR